MKKSSPWLIVLMLLLAACGPATDQTDGPAPTTPLVIPTTESNPLSVTVTRDDGRAASDVLFASEGGTLTATAADGTVFTLTIPPDALLSDEIVTMTPIESIDDLPFSGGLVAAVDIAPEELRLFYPATLTIESAEPVPVQEEIVFAYHGSGQELFLYPPDLDTDQISLTIFHFSGYGVAKGNDADRVAQLQWVPSDPEDELAQILGDLISEERRLRAVGSGQFSPKLAALVIVEGGDRALDSKGDYATELQKALDDYYQQQIAPYLQYARTDCSFAKKFIYKALSWTQQLLLLGAADDNDSRIREIQDTTSAALENCYNEAKERCDIVEMVTWARQLLLLGGKEVDLDGDIAKCTIWYGTITKTSTIQYTDVVQFYSYQEYGNSAAMVRVESAELTEEYLEDDYAAYTLFGTATITYNRSDERVDNCGKSTSTAHAQGSAPAEVYLVIEGDTYGIQVGLPSVTGTSTYTSPPVCDGEAETVTEPLDWLDVIRYIEGRVDTSNPNLLLLAGSETYPLFGGDFGDIEIGTETIRWNLIGSPAAH